MTFERTAAVLVGTIAGLGLATPAAAQIDAGVEDAAADAGADASPDAGPDGGPDACGDACGPELRCIVVDGVGYCGLCAPGETRPCEACPGSTQVCGGDLFWDPCDCAGCGDGPACGPGLSCIDVDGAFYCGICHPGDTQPCDNGCGPGVETCESNLFWGRCVPSGEVECVPGDTMPCASECGAGHMECQAESCEWSETCVPNNPIQCIPGTTSPCIVIGSCQGTQTCDASCAWSGCVAPPGGCHVCGDGVVDEGEDCDDGNLWADDDCDEVCGWAKARPFKSCDCGAAAGLPGGAGAISLLVAAACVFGLIRRRRVR